MQAQMTAPSTAYRQELRAHWSDMRESLGRFRQWRAPWSVVIGFALLALIGGWLGGFFRGMETQTQISNYVSAFKQSFAAKENAEGRHFLYEKFFLQDVDHIVLDYVRQQEAPLSKRLWAMTAPTYWLERNLQVKWKDSIARYAERRLALVPTVRPESIQELRSLGKSEAISNMNASYFEETARAYSVLLGRKVTADQLNPDAYLQEIIFNLKQAK
ncbi:MAG: hypothetical protein HY255_12400 [Betaproteobacteria bacterium]|nr:hypothetical protein [Betaproteobacteria bacterium]